MATTRTASGLGLARASWSVARYPRSPVPEDLVTISVGSHASISATSNWQSSFDWAIKTLAPVAKSRTIVDFLAAQPLRYALQARDARGVRLVTQHIVALHRLPSLTSLMLGLSGIASRSRFQKVMAFMASKG